MIKYAEPLLQNDVAQRQDFGPHPVLLELIRTIGRLDFSINRLTLALENYNMASNPPGHQAPGSKEVELPNDDGYAAKLPKR